MDYYKMASNIYRDSSDMDWADYEETKEEDIKEIASALEKIKGYADNNYDFSALLQSLERIYGEE